MQALTPTVLLMGKGRECTVKLSALLQSKAQRRLLPPVARLTLAAAAAEAVLVHRCAHAVLAVHGTVRSCMSNLVAQVGSCTSCSPPVHFRPKCPALPVSKVAKAAE